MDSIGKRLVGQGLVLAAAGIALLLLSRLDARTLPGDISRRPRGPQRSRSSEMRDD